MPEAAPEISIVVPVFNEAPNLQQLHQEIVGTMEALGRDFEIIAVDDGSRDGSLDVLKSLHEKDPRVRVVRLARNFGQNPALYAGFERVRGQIVVTIDADLQNPPAEIPKLIDKLDGGYDIVQGWRVAREDNLLRRTASRAVNGAVARLSGTKIKDLGSGLKVYRREIVDRLLLSTHHTRYLPAETAWLGVRVGEVEVAHRNRSAGESKYGLFALLRVNFDMIASISAAPVQLIGLLGGAFACIGFALGIRVLYVRVFHGDVNQLGSIVAAFSFLAGVQMLCTSILCEYVSRIYLEVQNRPYYIVGEIIE